MASSQRTLADLLESRLILYTLAAGCTLTATPASYAKVHFTPSSGTFTGVGTYGIDLDNDGATDFRFILSQCRSFSGYQSVGCWTVKGGRRYDQIIMGQFEFTSAMVKGAEVGFHRRLQSGGSMGTAFGYIGNWGGTSDRYLGVKFLINGRTHFGWIGFRSVTGFQQIVARLLGWAYETIPNKSILTGDTGSSESATVQPTSLELLSAGYSGVEQRRKRTATAGGN